MKNIIYGLTDPLSGALRYVGKSTKGMSRPESHDKPWALKMYRNTHKGKWVQGLVARGLRPGIVLLEVCPDPDCLYDHEQFWISYFRRLGCPLTNLTDGGRGAQGLKMSPESRAKMSAAKRGKALSPARQEALRKMLASNVGRKWPERPQDWKDNIAKGLRVRFPQGRASPRKGYVKSEEEKIADARAQGGQPFLDETGVRYETLGQAASALGVSRTKICACLQGRRKSTGGHTFRFIDARRQSPRE